MPRRPSPQELLQSAQSALSLRSEGEAANARQLGHLARLRARMPQSVPSDRNRQIFEDVVIRRKPQEEVARSAHISRQRVARIVQQVRDWIALCEGDDAAYGPEQRYRLATHVATSELAEFQRLIGQALEMADRTIEGKKFRRNRQGGQVLSEINYQSYPRPAGLYKMLLTAILARASFAGAGRDAQAGLTAASGSQSKVARTGINVNQGASSPPKGALRSDNLSEATCARPSAGTSLRNPGHPKELGVAAEDSRRP
jgi:hypothetical protein